MGVNTTAKVIKTTFDVLQDRYSSVEIGDMRASISETIAGQAETISSLPQTIQQAVLNATGWLTGDNGGYVIFRRNDAGQLVEQFISDSLDLQTAKNVWRWNLGGLGFSANGVNGPYRLAITQDGRIVADFVTAGILTAITIQSMDGKSTWNLSTGEMDLYNTKITTSAQGSTFVTADYTEDDLARLRNLILNQASPTLNDYEKLDVDGDGRFTAVDLLYVRQAIDGTQEINFTTGWKFALDPTDGENLLKLTKTWHNNLTSESTEHLVLGAGFGNVRVNALSIADSPIIDFVIEQGTSDIWTYQKWNSGLLEYWGREQFLTLDDGWCKSSAGPFAILTSKPVITNVTFWYGDGTNPSRNAWSGVITTGGVYADGAISIYIRNSDGTWASGERAFNYYVRAWWK